MFSRGVRRVVAAGLRSAYTDTRTNLRINKDTRVICQGFTGRQVSLILSSGRALLCYACVYLCLGSMLAFFMHAFPSLR
jgi:hypothetical protein